MIPHHQLKSFFNITWNPFLTDLPTSAFLEEEQITQFCWNVEQLVLDGGYALVTGEPGTGKSVALRLLQQRLSQVSELKIRVLSRPQSRVRDFYRELSSLFGVDIQISNRYGSFQKIREQWLSLIHGNHFRPVLIIDEAQEIHDEVLAELRLLGSTDLDARCILAVVFAGDSRLLNNLQSPTCLPLLSRIKARLSLEKRTPETMREIIQHALKNAGNPELFSTGVVRALSEQHLGNPRAMMTTANQLLNAALQKEVRHVDENLYFEVTRNKKLKR